MDKKGVEKIIARSIPLLVILGLLLVPLAAGNIGTAQAQLGSVQNRLCTIDNIAAYENRIHVRCTTGAPAGVFYYAVSTVSGPASSANRMLALLNTAYILGQPVTLQYDDSASNNPTGCLTSDCRKLLMVLLQ